MRKLLTTSALILTSTSIATAADYLWQPACDTDWNTCCGEIWNWQNNWGQSSVGVFCPVEPTANDNVTIGSNLNISATTITEVRTLIQTGGTLTLASSGGLRVGQTAQIVDLDWQVGRISGGSDGIYLNDQTVLNGPAIKYFGDPNVASRIVNSGTISWAAGNIQMDTPLSGPQSNRTVLINAPAGTIDITCDQTLSETNSVVLNNQGVIQKTGGSGTTVLNTYLDNSGTIHAEVGTIELRCGTNSGMRRTSGTLSAADGARLDIYLRQLDVQPGAAFSGDVHIFDNGTTSPTVVFSNDITVQKLTIEAGARVGGLGIYRVGERLDMAGASFGPELRVLAGAHLDITSAVDPFTVPIRISGTTRLAAGASIGCVQQPIYVLAPGRLDIEDGASITGTGFTPHGPSVFGILRKSSSSGAASISNQSAGRLYVAPTGRIEVLGGSLNVVGPMLIDGTVMVADRATLSASGATLNANAGSTFTGGGTLNVTGSLNLSNSTISPGAPTGTLAVTGSPANVSLGSGSALNIQLGGVASGQFDSISVAGALTLGGVLNLSLINGFEPQVGQTFAIVTAGSLSGTFAAVTGGDVGNGRTFEVSYLPTGVLLTVTGTVVPGDVDGDGSVDLTDLSLLLAAFGTCDSDAAYNAAADFNASGCVDLADLSQLLANFGA